MSTQQAGTLVPKSFDLLQESPPGGSNKRAIPHSSVSLSFSANRAKCMVMFNRIKISKFYLNPTGASLKRLERFIKESGWDIRVNVEPDYLFVICLRPNLPRRMS